MKKSTLLSVLGVIIASSVSSAYAEEKAPDACIAEIQKLKVGEIIKLEKLNVSGKLVYEFETKDSNGFETELMCDAAGKIIEKETEVSSASDEAFKKSAKVSEHDAATTALKANPGKIEEVEYEIEANGNGSYEFDIVSDKGVETKIEVDAVTGKIIETATEEWEIGEEASAKK